jgi:hypothetical protein
MLQFKHIAALILLCGLGMAVPGYGTDWGTNAGSYIRAGSGDSVADASGENQFFYDGSWSTTFRESTVVESVFNLAPAAAIPARQAQPAETVRTIYVLGNRGNCPTTIGLTLAVDTNVSQFRPIGLRLVRDSDRDGVAGTGDLEIGTGGVGSVWAAEDESVFILIEMVTPLADVLNNRDSCRVVLEMNGNRGTGVDDAWPGFYPAAGQDHGDRQSVDLLWSITGIDTLRPVMMCPGDCNNDGVVNVLDVLPIGIYFGLHGPARADAGLDTLPVPVAIWPGDSLAAYADADGNGVVDVRDVIVIASHWQRRWTASKPAFTAGAELAGQTLQQHQEAFLAIYHSILANRDREGFREIIAFLEQMLFVRVPVEPRLAQNQPNPFLSNTAITFDVPSASGEPLVPGRDYSTQSEVRTSLTVYDTKGNPVRVLLRKTFLPGTYTETWNGRDEDGLPAAAGIYVYVLETPGKRLTGRMLLNSK